MPLRIALALLLVFGSAALAEESSKSKKKAPSADVEKTDKKPRMSVSRPEQHQDYAMKKMKEKATSGEEDTAKGMRSSDRRQPKQDKSGGKSQPAKKN